MMSNESKYDSISRRVLDRTREIIDAVGPRPVGADSTKRATDMLVADARSYTTSVAIEPFSVHPGAFLGWIRVSVVLYLVALPFLWLGWYSGAATLGTAIIVIMVAEFFLYRELLDPLFPHRVGRNIIATVEPEGEVERQVIVSGHHDSAQVFTFFVEKPERYALRVNGGIGAILLLTVAGWVMAALQAAGVADAGAAGGAIAGVTAVRLAVAIPFTLLALPVIRLWRFASPAYSPGAGDNLASSVLAIDIGRHFAAPGNRLKHTRVVAASFDAEECGLRGARAYARAHREALAGLPTAVINMDCVYSVGDFAFLTSDVNGSVRLSRELAGSCAIISQEKGVPGKTQPIAFLTGGTDAGEFGRIGVPATTLIGMPWSNTRRGKVYHTPGDTVESIEPSAIAGAAEVLIDYITRSDRGDLPTLSA